MLTLMKKSFSSLTCLVAGVLSVFILTVGNGAFAQPIFDDGFDVGLTSFYSDPFTQEEKVESLKSIGFDVMVPLQVPSEVPIMPKMAEVDTKEFGNGAFQSAELDFATAVPSIPGTDTRISFSGRVEQVDGMPTTAFLYSVVAGKPKASCPIEVEETQIAFFDNPQDASERATSLSNDGFLVYVSVNAEAQAKAIERIGELKCLIVNGKTQKVTVDFRNISNLLPPRLQQQAARRPFIYTPKSDAIYLVNARRLYEPKEFFPAPTASELSVGLYDADSNALVASLEEGTVLQASDLGDRNLTIAAFVPESSPLRGKVRSISLDLNKGQIIKNENTEPYALFGDNPRGDFNGGSLNLKEMNTLTLEGYDQRDSKGARLGSFTINFTVTGS